MAYRETAFKIDAMQQELRHTAGVVIDERVRRYMAEHNCEYEKAFRMVLQDPDNAGTVRAYSVGQ